MRKCSSNAGGNTDGAKKIWSWIGDVWTYCRTFVCRFIYILHKIKWKWNTWIRVKTPELSTSFSYFYNFILCCVHQLCSILFHIFVLTQIPAYAHSQNCLKYNIYIPTLKEKLSIRTTQWIWSESFNIGTILLEKWAPLYDTMGVPRYTNEYTLFKFIIYDLNHLYIKYIYVINHSV